ncbi:hypothetical protein ACFPT7_14190 [Acidicapsa dinghuensis]|uniref:Restriction endonuclease type IV Mrr domain-containing protein n=1 Tax=Acidicapsa dinghuensis TaxID=2218256 RepID=A0ABW1EGP3_9BACT|nr:hypothetical protein [Acidicapsa dinghuensis]
MEAELINANDSLVTVLKNGTRKILRRDLRERFRFNREDLHRFSRQHPEILKKYKETLPAQAKPISDFDIELRQKYPREINLADLVSQLDGIKPGGSDAGKYHSAILGILQAIFYPSLANPKKEVPVDEGRKRIDITFDNAAESGFFSRIVHHHQVFAPYVLVECKNYSQDPENPEFDQLKGRFGRKRGNFGLLVCRRIDNPDLMLKRCKDIVNNSDQIILVLEDVDIRELIRLRNTRGEAGVTSYMQTKLNQILM